MSKRGDNIHKRKDGRWEGRYPKGRTERGTMQYGSVYGKTYRETKEKLAQIIIQKSENTHQNKTDMDFKNVLKLWMDNNQVRLKGGTINKYQNLIDAQIVPELGNEKLSELSSARINQFLNMKLQAGRVDNNGGLSPSYVRSIMLVINAALKFAAEEQLCPPLRTPIYKPAVVKNELQILTIEEQRQLEAQLLTELNPIKAGILLSLHTGLRIGEVCALSWDNIDFQNHIIRVRHTVARIRNPEFLSNQSTCLIIDKPKSHASTRDIPISSFLLPILSDIKKISKSKYVISKTDNFVKPRTYEYNYHQILKKSGVSSINYHALRHTFATRCIEAGVDVKSLSEILGHANVGVTLNTYVHSSMELKRNQIEKLTLLTTQYHD